MATLVVTQNKDGKEEIIYEGTGEVGFLEEDVYMKLVYHEVFGINVMYFDALNSFCLIRTDPVKKYHSIDFNRMNYFIKKYAIDDELLLHLAKGGQCWVAMDKHLKILVWVPAVNGNSFSQFFHHYEKMLTENHNMTFKWSETASLSEDATDT